jgi:hypothetical protein
MLENVTISKEPTKSILFQTDSHKIRINKFTATLETTALVVSIAPGLALVLSQLLSS